MYFLDLAALSKYLSRGRLCDSKHSSTLRCGNVNSLCCADMSDQCITISRIVCCFCEDTIHYLGPLVGL